VADEQLALARVHLEVKADNVRAIRAYQAAGFLPDATPAGTDGSIVMIRERG
jgi:RimJ/RimL family protein N-acetyltransferase